MQKIVVAMTGASGSLYAIRLLDVLLASGCHVHLTISPAAVQVLSQEVGIKINLNKLDLKRLLLGKPVDDSVLGALWSAPGESFGANWALEDDTEPDLPITYHHYHDFSAGVASGSFLTDGMVICPCSMGTLASIAHGMSTNLIHRAADVHLKERRKLIVVPRETPLSSIQLDNMKRLADAGAVILPAMPGFYHNPISIQDLVDFVVNRICDQLGLRRNLINRWGVSEGD